MSMACSSLLTPRASKPTPPALTRPASSPPPTLVTCAAANAAAPSSSGGRRAMGRRELAAILSSSAALLVHPAAALAENDAEYVKETEEVISKLRNAINMDKKDPNVATAVADLRDASNSWVAKYRREKSLLGRTSFRDMYSALNAVSGHYISFGPTAPIPAKRKARILEEVDTAEKALLRGR